MLRRCLLLLCLWLAAGPGARAQEAQVVVALRSLREKGESHASVFLYRLDGTLLRALTRPTAGQDHDPVFSPDGREVVFARQTGAGEEWWRIGTDGRGLTRLPAPPAWQALAPPAGFSLEPFVPIPNRPGERRLRSTTRRAEIRYEGEGGALLTLRTDESRMDEADAYFPKTASLRPEEGRPEVPLESLPTRGLPTGRPAGRPRPGPEPATPPGARPPGEGERPFAHPLLRAGSPFLRSGALRVLFFTQEHSQTDRPGLFAVSLSERCTVELAPNGGRIVPVPGQPWFFTVCAEPSRLPGKGSRTVQGTFLDRWDAGLQRVRYAGPEASLFYGACLRTAEGARTVLPWDAPEE